MLPSAHCDPPSRCKRWVTIKGLVTPLSQTLSFSRFQMSNCTPLDYKKDTCKIWTLQSARLSRKLWDTRCPKIPFKKDRQTEIRVIIREMMMRSRTLPMLSIFLRWLCHSCQKWFVSNYTNHCYNCKTPLTVSKRPDLCQLVHPATSPNSCTTDALMHHVRRYVRYCIARMNIQCNADKNLWPEGYSRKQVMWHTRVS